MLRVLFVCLGNICRSPMAEGIFNFMRQKRDVSDRVKAFSAGISSNHIGEDPDPRASYVTSQHGIELQHKARLFKPQDFEIYDFIIPMDLINQAAVLQYRHRALHPKAEVIMMRKFDPIGDTINVPDPFYGDIDDFEEVYEILYRSISVFLDHLVETYRL